MQQSHGPFAIAKLLVFYGGSNGVTGIFVTQPKMTMQVVCLRFEGSLVWLCYPRYGTTAHAIRAVLQLATKSVVNLFLSLVNST